MLQQLIEGLKINRTLEWLDIRECDIYDRYVKKINKLLFRNRNNLDEINIDSEEDEAEVFIKQELPTEETLPETVEEEEEEGDGEQEG